MEVTNIYHKGQLLKDKTITIQTEDIPQGTKCNLYLLPDGTFQTTAKVYLNKSNKLHQVIGTVGKNEKGEYFIELD